MIGALIGVGTILAATYSHSRLFLKAYQYLFPMTQFLSSTRDNLACETKAPDEIGELPAEELPLQLLLKTILDTLNCRCVLYQMMCSLSECSMEVPQSPESDTTVFAPFSDKLMGALLNVAPTHCKLTHEDKPLYRGVFDLALLLEASCVPRLVTP
ncbi:hypothetical protein M431DRAFT_554505 [Trichoderma harzianum CBS 226.95]|uniref:Uncharacterized protein n=1 Tax=Trichoderma harzianum CBS 226.95 TaxID=983964 RepID=A0A2T3ZRF4_TRIHA|nr:hypothetical protein M431DRAFT_554505 [Trichoderma harzianum CBS 226.95]PTB47387.1 hypothetical protein M431DRAFT_554505 [Trichoderma harzianum CBS 226.95]